MICSVCQSILNPSQKAVAASILDKKLRIHHPSRRSLKRSVELGCYVCNRFSASLRPADRRLISTFANSESDFEEKIDISSIGAPAESTKPFVTAFRLEDGPPYGHLGWYQLKLAVNLNAMAVLDMVPSRTGWCATFLLQPQDGSCKRNIGDGLSENTLSAKTFSLAKNWITDCAANHQQCNKATPGKGWYPTRLLELGSPDRPGRHWRLIETNHVAVEGPYITLSHCWGSAECMKLTTDNYASMLLGMPSTLLPQLYQDALHVAFNLGIRYLWIDSLCIIQTGDELADWRHEVALMSEVYTNSFCNISAMDAPDAHHSMFCSRDPNSLCPEIVHLATGSEVAPYLISHTTFWDSEVSHALVNTRAWVLQERLLSRRILHFGERQLLWECQMKDAAEVYPDGLPPEISSSSSRFKSLSPDRYTSRNDSNVGGHLLWQRIVEKYTACGITYPGDKLVALSAIAKTLTPVLQDEYVAGMWRRYLACELLWNASTNQEKKESGLEIYRAPSWSWAAVNGLVDPGRPDIERTDLLMKLRGVLKPILLLKPCSSATSNGRDWEIIVNGTYFSTLNDSEEQGLQVQVMLDAPHNDFEEQNAKAALYCMPGRVRRVDDGSIYVLLLEMLDRAKGIFRRIGLARGWGADTQARILARSMEESQFPCEEYTQAGHLIRVI
ncbi:heterokaryon incompatibility protein [Ilyonectria sp. MPI-CAGE-AT-0026]|nr:heterokaryon incompatibility protein [Ilyonectria sp. MPI-CAGE-AT-0026]